MDQGGATYDEVKVFSPHNSTMTLTLDLESWFKVTEHTLNKGTLWVKFEPDWAKGREDMPQTSDLGWKDG